LITPFAVIYGSISDYLHLRLRFAPCRYDICHVAMPGHASYAAAAAMADDMPCEMLRL